MADQNTLQSGPPAGDNPVFTREPRASREKSMRPQAWKPPELLPMPEERKGWTHRWIRTSMSGESDPVNVSAKLREGWEPCKAKEYPELMLQARADGNIEVGGLMLCRIPEEFMIQRAEYFGTQNKQQIASVDNNFMRENDPRMPLFKERETKVAFGNGS